MTNLPIPVEQIDALTAPAIYYKDGLKPYFEYISNLVRTEVVDATTKEGQARLVTLAAEVSRSKVAVEKPGRAYLKAIKENTVREIEAELKWFVDACDKLRDAVRAPVTALENAEKARIAGHNYNLTMIHELTIQPYATLGGIDGALAYLATIQVDETCEEFLPKYTQAVADAGEILVEKRAKLVEWEAGAAARQREHDERVAAEAVRQHERTVAADKARLDRELADVTHQTNVHAEILRQLVDFGMSSSNAVALLDAIAGGHLKYLEVNYAPL